jgi:hypothetical protein
MASTVGDRYVTGKVTATNADLPIRKIGYKPKKVIVSNLSNNVKIEWNDSLGDGYAIKTVEAGTRSLLTSGAITPLDPDSAGNPGFQIGAGLADINDTTTESLLYETLG